MSWKPDRRPFHWISFTSGPGPDSAHPLLNEAGGLFRLVDSEMAEAQRNGERKVMLSMPQLHPRGQSFYPSASAFALRAGFMEFFCSARFASMLSAYGIQALGLFTGSPIPRHLDPTTINDGGAVYSPGERLGLRPAWVWSTLAPWLAVPKLKEFWFDAGSGFFAEAGVSELALGTVSAMIGRKVPPRVGIEAIPDVEGPPGKFRPVMEKVARHPCVASLDLVWGRPASALEPAIVGIDPGGSWTFDPATTEVHVTVEHMNISGQGGRRKFTRADQLAFESRGWIVDTKGGVGRPFPPAPVPVSDPVPVPASV
jgi:hypothetical protein